MKIGMISLGCPKNLTDTEVILGKLVHAGHEITNDEKKADVLIINTCAFIKPAIDEAMAEIRRAVKLKEKGYVKHVIVAGCLPSRIEGKGLEVKGKRDALGRVDAFVSSGNIDKIVECVNSLEYPSHLLPHTSNLSSPGSLLFDWKTPRIKATPRHYSYLKIADGCDNRCSYCAVPKIRGKYKSRPIEDIVREAKLLGKSGTKELILIAQDTTYYGKDLYGEFALPKLLKKLCRISGLKWIRIMYTHPAHFTDELIKTMAKEPKIVKYIDLPLQHSCDKILGRMGRRVSGGQMIALIAKIRGSVPGIAVRTSLIVGFPSETAQDFDSLLDLIKKERFERLGIFVYSKEKGTPASSLRGQVPERLKKIRYHKAMRLQNRISRSINEEKINRAVEAMIDKRLGNGYIGRSYMDAPEIDGSVFMLPPGGGRKFVPGEVVKMMVSKASAYDLFGKILT